MAIARDTFNLLIAPKFTDFLQDAKIIQARNLLAELHSPFNPIDFTFDKAGVKMIVAGSGTGKTTLMLTLGQICYLAQTGVPVPCANGTCLPLFEHMLALIQNQEDSTLQKSFFYKHIEQTMALLHSFESNSHRRTLALLDNLGKGTSSLNAMAVT